MIIKALVVVIGIGVLLVASAIPLVWAGFWVAYGVQLAGGIQ